MEDTTRRQVMTVSTLGAAAAAVSTSAAAAKVTANGQPRGGKQDPRSKYPKPPFNPQSQPWPGLASQMDPRPDHGETSYVGSGRLAGRKALITGGDSGMGRAGDNAMIRQVAASTVSIVTAHLQMAEQMSALVGGS